MHDTDDRLMTGTLLEVTRQPLWTWLPWALCAALFVLWIFTFCLMYFGSQLSTWQSLGVLRQDLIAAVQQVGQSVQTLDQRVKALEKGADRPTPGAASRQE
jgi:hypothetical protein